jgi:hypothetical protein
MPPGSAKLLAMQNRKHWYSMDWRVVFGLIVTTAWVSTGLLYLLGLVGWDRFVQLPTADIGSFLEGAFAPLAFLWLVIGHFMQQKEITANTQAMQSQQESAKQQELLAARDNYFKLLELIQEQLAGIAAFHYMSVCGPTGTGEITADEFAEQRSKITNDPSWFTSKMIRLAAVHREEPDQLQEVFLGTETRARHTDNFETTFGKLLKVAQSVDADEMLENALLNGTASGLLYKIIRQIKGKEPIDSIFGAATSTKPTSSNQ